MRNDGIIWTDARFQNIGKLKRDNIVTFNSKEMYIEPNSVGFNKEIKQPPLLISRSKKWSVPVILLIPSRLNIQAKKWRIISGLQMQQ